MSGANPIPLSEINALFHIYEISDIQSRDDYVFFIRSLDRVYLRLDNERVERERKRLEAQANKPVRGRK